VERGMGDGSVEGRDREEASYYLTGDGGDGGGKKEEDLRGRVYLRNQMNGRWLLMIGAGMSHAGGGFMT